MKSLLYLTQRVVEKVMLKCLSQRRCLCLPGGLGNLGAWVSLRRPAPGQTFGLERFWLGQEVRVWDGTGADGGPGLPPRPPPPSGMQHQLGLPPLLSYSPVITLNAASVVMTTYYPSLGKSPICRGVRLSPAPWAPSLSLQAPPSQGSPAGPPPPLPPILSFQRGHSCVQTFQNFSVTFVFGLNL